MNPPMERSRLSKILHEGVGRCYRPVFFVALNKIEPLDFPYGTVTRDLRSRGILYSNFLGGRLEFLDMICRILFLVLLIAQFGLGAEL
jgi:hypothetical protein